MDKQCSGPKSRAIRLAGLQMRDRVPVLIVGGGINGISTWRELALQGVPAILVEQGDWCQAASGALSRMIHGGLRYLETGEFGLVKESVTERDRLLKNAPHYVFPLRTTVPIDNWHGGLMNAAKRFFHLSEKPGRRGALLIKTGLSFYDLYTRTAGTMPRHQLNGQRTTRQRWPGFADWVKYSATYYDAWITAPERLGIELIEDAEQACHAALALNYMAVVGGDAGEILLEDRLSGTRYTLRPEVVVNASGAWIDRLNGALMPTARQTPLIGGTKGSHLILRSPELLQMLDGDMVYYENQEGRVCIMFPWYGHVLVGSTDIRVDDPDAVVCEASEQAYILDSVRFVFPHLTIRNEDVLYTFCGVRPLPASDSTINGKISRNHTLVEIAADAQRPFTTFCLVGGKWTTFRQFGEEAADRVLAQLRRERQVSTAALAIGGGRDYPTGNARLRCEQQLSEQSGLSLARIQQLFTRYGTRINLLLPVLQASPDRPLRHHPDYSLNEIRFLARYEQVGQLEDLLVRRTALAISGCVTTAGMEEVSQVLAETLGWSEPQRITQLELTRDRLIQLHGMQFSTPFIHEEPLHVSNQ